MLNFIVFSVELYIRFFRSQEKVEKVIFLQITSSKLFHTLIFSDMEKYKKNLPHLLQNIAACAVVENLGQTCRETARKEQH